MRSTKLFPHPALKMHDKMGIITPWRDIIAVLSGMVTRQARGVLAHLTGCRLYVSKPYCSCSAQEKQGPFREKSQNLLSFFLRYTFQNCLFWVLKSAPHFLPLHLHHWDHAIPADDMDLLGGPDALPALGTNELSGGAGPLAARGGSSRLGGASGPGAYHRGQGTPPNLDFTPALLQGVFHKPVAGPGVPAVLLRPVALQAPPLGLLLEPLIVICTAPAHFLDSVLAAIEVYELVTHGI